MAQILLDPRPGESSPAEAAYDALAPFYDAFTADYPHESLLGALLELASECGFQGRRVFDVGCGTGKSFVPLAERGLDVVACDISPQMVGIAQDRLRNGERRVFVADMRDLPPVGPVDLVTCLDDAVNYLLDGADLQAALEGMARSLGPGGLAIFDVNSLLTYRATFASDFALERDGTFFCWRGEGRPDAEPGEPVSATVEVFSEAHPGCWRRTTSRHFQRHHPREAIELACALAGLELVAARGLIAGGRLEPLADEGQHPKVVYAARKPHQE
jgi:SAM-dependent methyltransferase